MKKRFSKLLLSITSIVMAIVTLSFPAFAVLPKNVQPYSHTTNPLATFIPEHFFQTWILENEKSIKQYGSSFWQVYHSKLMGAKDFFQDEIHRIEKFNLDDKVLEYPFLLYQACLANKYMYRNQTRNSSDPLKLEPISTFSTVFLISDILTNKVLRDIPHSASYYSKAMGLPLEFINNELILFLQGLNYNSAIHLGEIEIMATLLGTRNMDQSTAILSTDSSEIINYINERPMDAAVDKETAKTLSSYIKSIYKKLPINTYEFLTAIDIAKQYKHHAGIVIDKNNLFQILSSTILAYCAKNYNSKGYHKAYLKFNEAISDLNLPYMGFDNIMKYITEFHNSDKIQSKFQSVFIRKIIDLSEAIPSLRDQAYLPSRKECDYLMYMGEKLRKTANSARLNSSASSSPPSNSTSSSSQPSSSSSSSSSSKNTSPTPSPSPPSTNESSPSPSSPNPTDSAPFSPSSPRSCDLNSIPSPNSLDSYNDSPIPKNPPPTPIPTITSSTPFNKKCKIPAN